MTVKVPGMIYGYRRMRAALECFEILVTRLCQLGRSVLHAARKSGSLAGIGARFAAVDGPSDRISTRNRIRASLFQAVE